MAKLPSKAPEVRAERPAPTTERPALDAEPINKAQPEHKPVKRTLNGAVVINY